MVRVRMTIQGGGSGGSRAIGLWKGGSGGANSNDIVTTLPAATTNHSQDAVGATYLTAGDILSGALWQNSGSTQNLSQTLCRIEAVRLAA